ncbi:hypothetical protein NDU88_003987 [Pleurodeles waltl]|uniref:Uncharacterized protein n=1 Tax=Pleurodeles waltl TaxID=8319 RepID=A0AAV7QD90_PLEWA|nr:hypothetical protein NDU88_003987 [Pleurodeles waltl]
MQQRARLSAQCRAVDVLARLQFDDGVYFRTCLTDVRFQMRQLILSFLSVSRQQEKTWPSRLDTPVLPLPPSSS